MLTAPQSSYLHLNHHHLFDSDSISPDRAFHSADFGIDNADLSASVFAHIFKDVRHNIKAPIELRQARIWLCPLTLHTSHKHIQRSTILLIIQYRTEEPTDKTPRTAWERRQAKVTLGYKEEMDAVGWR